MIMEEREKQAKDIVESIEREWAGVGEQLETNGHGKDAPW